MNELQVLQQNSQNNSVLQEVLLLGFQGPRSSRFLLFTMFTGIYTLILSGNILIIFTTISNQLLHSPMYFFLCNLSLSEMLLTTNIIPKMLQVLIRNRATMSLFGCLTQFFFFGIFILTDTFLLTAMSYDRYLAICRPLHYSNTMHFWLICYLSAACWIIPYLVMSASMGIFLKLHYCGKRNQIDHFFCDRGPIVRLACSDTAAADTAFEFISASCSLFPFIFIILTYVFIVRDIIKIQSVTGKRKAFSTCSSHLSVVSTHYLTLFIVYLVPISSHSLLINKFLSLLYTVVTPLLNPFIYSLSNREIKEAIGLPLKFRKKV
ncbi:hypothetical protein GDO86_017731 [Hymenochirus boettgeri]|uniref:Olfactory receptor n=1 Tax=Hymenochirus boettgeri TaxID=247094 RepID=A0A8T2INJ1_9PIPI|nr:hypothetical protein GDO86_017731 [Hymenochirus boettgeri]